MIDFGKSQTCLGCRFWVAVDDDLGVCRRYAPKPVPVAILQDDDGNAFSEPMWPITAADEWCGEFEEDRVDGKTCE